MEQMAELILSPKINKAQLNVIKFAMFMGAIIFTGLGVFSKQLGFEDVMVSYVLFGIAFMDFMMAFTVPNIIKKAYESNSFSFYKDHLSIKYAGHKADIDYSKIESIEKKQTPQQRKQNKIDVHINLVEPVPEISAYLSKYKITNLDENTYPIDKIQKIVEVKIISS